MMASLRERRPVRPCGPSACASRSGLFLRYRWRPPRASKGCREDADKVVCLEDHESFSAIGFYYADFRQVSDKEVVDVLTRFTDSCESAGTSRSDTANSVNPWRPNAYVRRRGKIIVRKAAVLFLLVTTPAWASDFPQFDLKATCLDAPRLLAQDADPYEDA